jgi:hypothetical protein
VTEHGLVAHVAATVATLVYDWDDRNDPEKIVHLVADETQALSARNAAFCGVQPGKFGWVIWHGHVSAARQCELCYSRPAPRLPAKLTEAQLDGRACVRCRHEPEIGERMRPVEAWSELSSQLFECVDVEACSTRLVQAQQT